MTAGHSQRSSGPSCPLPTHDYRPTCYHTLVLPVERPCVGSHAVRLFLSIRPLWLSILSEVEPTVVFCVV